MARLLIIVSLCCVISAANMLNDHTVNEDKAMEYMEKRFSELTTRLNKDIAIQHAKIAQQNTKFAEQATKIANQDTKFAVINTRLAEQDCFNEKLKIASQQNNCSAEEELKFVNQAAQIADQKTVIDTLNNSLAEKTAEFAEQIANLNTIIANERKSLALERKKEKCLENIALNKPAAHSSTGWAKKADYGNDGNNKTCAWTDPYSTRHQWWCVDLHEEYNISKIVITTSRPYWLPGFKVRFSNTGSCDKNGMDSAEICYTGPGVKKDLYVVKECNDGSQMTGRFVYIDRPVERLVICEAIIYSN